MSEYLSELEARLLISSLSRRTNLIELVKTYRLRFLWPLLVVQLLIAVALACLWKKISGSYQEGLLLFVVYYAGAAIVHLYINYTNRRIDALVQLLQQDGLLKADRDSVEQSKT